MLLHHLRQPQRQRKGGLEALAAGQGGDVPRQAGVAVQDLHVQSRGGVAAGAVLFTQQLVAAVAHLEQMEVCRRDDLLEVAGKHKTLKGKPLRIFAAGSQKQPSHRLVLPIELVELFDLFLDALQQPQVEVVPLLQEGKVPPFLVLLLLQSAVCRAQGLQIRAALLPNLFVELV